MARRSKTIVGLDIEPGSIAAVQVATADGLSVERAAVADLDPHVVRDGEVADGEALTEALKALWAQNGWLDRKVRIGVANARIVVRVVDLPPLEDPKDLAAAVQFQAKDELPMALDQAVMDFQSLGIVETPMAFAPELSMRSGGLPATNFGWRDCAMLVIASTLAAEALEVSKV